MDGTGTCCRLLGSASCFKLTLLLLTSFMLRYICCIAAASIISGSQGAHIPTMLTGYPMSIAGGRTLSSNDGGVAWVRNAQELVIALAQEDVEQIIITAAEVEVPYSAWNGSGVTLPIFIRRNVTLTGDTSFKDWPVINFNNVKNMMRLAGNCTFTTKRLFLKYIRDNPTFAVGLDVFLPTLPGETSYLIVENCGILGAVCFPNTFRIKDFNSIVRPSQFPGTQNVDTIVSQEGCTNDTHAHPIQRCWIGRGFIHDVAAACADVDPLTGSTKLNNQYAWIKDSPAMCETMVDEDCLTVLNKEPLVCFMEAQKKYEAYKAAATIYLPPPPAAMVSSRHGTERRRAVVISTITIVGTLLLVLVIGGIWVVAWLRHQQVMKKVVGSNLSTTQPKEQSGSINFMENHDVKVTPHHLQDSSTKSNDKAIRISQNNNINDLEESATPGDSATEPLGNDPNDSSPGAQLPAAPTTTAAGTIPITLGDGHHIADIPVTPLTPPRSEVVLDVRLVQLADKEQQHQQQPLPWGSIGEGTMNSTMAAPTVELLPVVLGKGSYGRVVEGLYGGRRVAVKLMAHEAPWGRDQDQDEQQQNEQPQQSPTGFSNAFVQSFVQEVQVLSRCQHPNVVQLLAACVTPPRLCLVMELMDISLEKLLYGNPGSGLMPLEKVLHIGISIANALTYLHPTIVHRDLKPANVLINDAASERPIVKLTDFGLARLRMTVRSTKTPDVGTPPYMGPECFDVLNNRICHQADIYSLGVLIWEMLAGQRPWEGVGAVAIAFMVAFKGARLPVESHLQPDRCPRKLARLLAACWEVDPARRPAAAEVLKELTLVLQTIRQQPSQQHEPTTTTPLQVS